MPHKIITLFVLLLENSPDL